MVAEMGPSPLPASPWHTKQYVSYTHLPRFSDSAVRVRGLASRSATAAGIESGSAPVTGTVPGTGGGARRGVGLVVRLGGRVGEPPHGGAAGWGGGAGRGAGAPTARARRSSAP